MRTELLWEGKYDEYVQRREVDIAGCAMPMLLQEFKGKVDLIYIDSTFDVGADFSMNVVGV
jgi:adenine-specific DNA-methyltransferase